MKAPSITVSKPPSDASSVDPGIASSTGWASTFPLKPLDLGHPSEKMYVKFADPPSHLTIPDGC